MSGDGEQRVAWAKFFEAQGIRAIRCAGPKATTCALDVATACPLHEEADLIFYDEESVTPRLEERLGTLALHAPIAYATTMRLAGEGEYPVIERVRSISRPGAPSR